jgi:hypothetical protein
MVAVKTRFTEVTGVGVPVQQAPMSSVSVPALDRAGPGWTGLDGLAGAWPILAS